MNILILNWRDPKNPRSGGAEAVTFKYAQYWGSLGHQVTWICNSFPGGSADQTISGVRFIRLGPALGFTVVQLLLTYPAFLIHAIWTAAGLVHKRKFDLAVDEIHGLPFFTPLYCRTRTVLWVCEVAGPIWDKMYPWPINIIGKLLERLIYWFYQRSEIWAISQNTRQDILGFIPQAKVKVIPLGVNPIPVYHVKKNPFPSAVFLARLVKMKGVEVALLAARDITRKLPNFKFYLIGTGSTLYVDYLCRLVDRAGVSKNVEFLGRISETEKYQVLAQSHFLIHTSYKEGFGLTVLEAGLVGTPSIVRSGSSLDELVTNGQNGYQFTSEDQISELFIKGINRKIYGYLTKRSKHISKRYLWSKILKPIE